MGTTPVRHSTGEKPKAAPTATPAKAISEMSRILQQRVSKPAPPASAKRKGK